MKSARVPSNILVSGGCGFLGANLVRFLIGAGCSVRVVDDLSTGLLTNLDGMKKIFIGLVDIRSKAVAHIVEGMDAVVHLAAVADVAQCEEAPEKALDINVNGTLNLLEACRKYGVGKFVFASSMAVTGSKPENGKVIPNLMNIYGASKLAGEALCMAYTGSFGMNTVSLRCANVYGKYSNQKHSVITEFIRQIRAGKPITVYGDGNQTRDFVHADDVCRAILQALCCGASGVFQLGTGAETSIRQLVGMMEELNGGSIDVKYEAPRVGDVVRRSVADIIKARELLRYEPSVDINTGLKLLWKM